jgi:predicted 3-demethylubiquinone-9 3-methyltransferase (glyoxalase superfamily)
MLKRAYPVSLCAKTLLARGEGATMQARIPKITPFLWFDDQAEEAARFYTSIFKNSKIEGVTWYGEEAAEASGRPKGTIMTVTFLIAGQEFVALNGGPHFKFNEAISFVVNCESQAEIDYYWDKLSEDGDIKAQQCGWLKDRYGVSWQIVPTIMAEFLTDPDPDKSRRVMQAILQMKKIDIEALKGAAGGLG